MPNENISLDVVHGSSPSIPLTLSASSVIPQATDKTLQNEDQPADAKAVGDEISRIDGLIAEIGSDLSDAESDIESLETAKMAFTDLDTTLSESGKPADAKAVSDAIDAAKDDITELIDTTLTEQGGIAEAKAVGDALNALSVDGITGRSINRFGVCSEIGSTAAKTVTVGSTFTPTSGTRITVLFSFDNTASSPTLAVNSGTAYPIECRNEPTLIKGVCDFVFYSNQWVLVANNYIDTDTDTIPLPVCSTDSGTVAKVAVCDGFDLNSESYTPILFTKNSTASAPTLNINDTGTYPLLINGQAGAYTKGMYIAYFDGTSYRIRSDGILPGMEDMARKKVITVSAAAEATSETVTDDWIAANTSCFAHTIENANPGTTVSWEFDDGEVTFTFGSALASSISFQFGMVK